mmetsp:Transcript_145231/g.404757  ORF Transcript_145231/g.404757 Transcript_145231/m.404757 type:complete len:226 (+) Transcript_145231:89-766(+)
MNSSSSSLQASRRTETVARASQSLAKAPGSRFLLKGLHIFCHSTTPPPSGFCFCTELRFSKPSARYNANAGEFLRTTTSRRSRTSAPRCSAQRTVPAISNEPSPRRWCDRWTLRWETSRCPAAFTTWTYPTMDGGGTGPLPPSGSVGTWTHWRVQWRGVLPAMMLAMACCATSSLSMTFTSRHQSVGASWSCQGSSAKTSKWSSTNSLSSSRSLHASLTAGVTTK